MPDEPYYTWFTPGGDPNRGKPLPVTLTFEGGGARGILHIGALRALEEVQNSQGSDAPNHPIYDIRGVNGTSIGALVAALVSAGYGSKDLLSNSPPYSNILKLTGYSHPKYMLNTRQRLAIWSLHHTFLSIWLILPITMVAFFAVSFVAANGFISLPHISAIFSAAFVGALTYFAARHCLMGLGSARKLGNFVDLAIAARINGYDDVKMRQYRKQIHKGTYDKLIKFSDIGVANIAAQQNIRSGANQPYRHPRLAIVATNLTTGRLEKFSVSRTPNVYVGDAVAASCSLPFLFEPYEIAQAPENQGEAPKVVERKRFKYVDGGITSNLPVWTSDVPRALNPDMVSISFGTVDDVRSSATTPKELVRGLVRSALFGAGVLETRRTRNVPYLLRGEKVGLLSFAVSYDTAMNEIDIAKRSVIDAMLIRSRRRSLFADAARTLCVEIARLAASNFRKPAAHEQSRDAIRVTVLEPTRFAQNGLKPYLLYCSDPALVHFEDDSMVYHGQHSLPGKAWQSQGQHFVWALPNQALAVDETIVGRRVWPGDDSRPDERLRRRLWPSKWACTYKLSWSTTPERYGVEDVSEPSRAYVVLVQSNVALESFRSNSPAEIRHYIENAVRSFDRRLASELRALVRGDLTELTGKKEARREECLTQTTVEQR